MGKLYIPYVADVKIDGEWHRNQQVEQLNAKTAWVRLDNGDIIKLHATKDKHKFVIKPVAV